MITSTPIRSSCALLKADEAGGFWRKSFRDWRSNSDNLQKQICLKDPLFRKILVAGKKLGGSSASKQRGPFIDYGFGLSFQVSCRHFQKNALNNALPPVQVYDLLKKVFRLDRERPKTDYVDLSQQKIILKRIIWTFDINHYRKHADEWLRRHWLPLSLGTRWNTWIAR